MSIDSFMAARELLLEHRDDYETAYRKFRWPELGEFNWASDWFDRYAAGNAQVALHLLSETGESKLSFAALSDRSSRLAQGFADLGLSRGDRVLVMLGNVAALWETVLACQKMGAVVVPTATQATSADLLDRIARGRAKMIVTSVDLVPKVDELAEGRALLRVVDGPPPPEWHALDDVRSAHTWRGDGVRTRASDPLLLYFTSGTTAKPKLVLHTHQSYPVGHLSTMYWIGIRPGSVHQNISSPGWAKHAWSSFYAPWNAGATVLMLDSPRFQPAVVLSALREHGVESLCAPPTVWRMLMLHELGERPRGLRELVSAGEPLNPEVIQKVQAAWGLSIRDGYGQTETTAQVGNAPGSALKPGAMGRPLPGYRIALLDAKGAEAREGELALAIDAARPVGLMAGYLDDPVATASAFGGGYYRTGDEASVDDDGYLTFVGRGDDVFKSSDYRISPFELESVLLEHAAVAESAVIPSPDPVRLSVPKAVIALKPGFEPNAALAEALFAFARERLAPYKRIRRLEFGELPKTISGKIRRVQLREGERDRRARGERAALEFFAEDFAREL